MPLFDVLIEVKQSYFSNIMVDAKDYPAAKAYLKNTIDWQEDECLTDDNAGGNHTEFKVKEVKSVDRETQIPKGYTLDSIPWNGTFTIREHFKNHEDPDHMPGN